MSIQRKIPLRPFIPSYVGQARHTVIVTGGAERELARAVQEAEAVRAALNASRSVVDSDSSGSAGDSESGAEATKDEVHELEGIHEPGPTGAGGAKPTAYEETFRLAVRQNIEAQMLLPPPEALYKKTVVENEAARTGAPIPFVKFPRLLGAERVEKLNPSSVYTDPGAEHVPTPSDIAPAFVMNDYLINARAANRLVYCRLGEKYVADLEKRKNSNISALNQPSQCLGSASYLINVRKLIEEHNIDGEKRDFKPMKTNNPGRQGANQPQPYY